MLDFVISKYIRMVFEENKTFIYFDNKPFRLCKGVFLNLTMERLYKLQDYSTIDEQIEYLKMVESETEMED